MGGYFNPWEQTIAPWCENCIEGECPGEYNCLKYLKSLRRERFYTQEQYSLIFEVD